MSTLLAENLQHSLDYYNIKNRLRSTKEVTNITNAIVCLSQYRGDLGKPWARLMLRRLKDFANACNIQDYPQYMGNFKNDKIYLGRYFLETDTQQGLKFCELYWTKCLDTVMLIAKYSPRDNDMDGVTVENIESSTINKISISEELKAAYIRYLLAV